MTDLVLLEREDNIAVVTINNPKSLNALNSNVLKALDEVIDQVNNDEKINAVVVTGAGEKAFVAGADIKEMKDLNAYEGRNFSELGNNVFHKLENLRQPTIAAIRGFTLGGGCELAMSCDIRLGDSSARFGQPEVGLGITPGFGGTQRLVRIVGDGIAKELIFTGGIIKADRAYEIGLLNKVVEEDVLEEAKKLAKKIASNAPLAVEASKKAINLGQDMPINQGIVMEAEMFGTLFATEDQKEGMTAFVEKQKASFKRK